METRSKEVGKVFKAEKAGDTQDIFLDFTSKSCSRGGQRGVSRSRSQWTLSHVREFGLCPEAGGQKLKDCKQ